MVRARGAGGHSAAATPAIGFAVGVPSFLHEPRDWQRAGKSECLRVRGVEARESGAEGMASFSAWKQRIPQAAGWQKRRTGWCKCIHFSTPVSNHYVGGGTRWLNIP